MTESQQPGEPGKLAGTAHSLFDVSHANAKTYPARLSSPRPAAIVALFQASVSQLTAQHYDAAQRQAWAPADADMPAWQTRLASLELLIAEDGRAIAGLIGFSLDGHIDLLFTAPGFARQDVASALYAAAERRLQAVGTLELFTEASLVAQAFFARQGFSVQQAQTVTRDAVILPRMLMRKTLEL